MGRVSWGSIGHGGMLAGVGAGVLNGILWQGVDWGMCAPWGW